MGPWLASGWCCDSDPCLLSLGSLMAGFSSFLGRGAGVGSGHPQAFFLGQVLQRLCCSPVEMLVSKRGLPFGATPQAGFGALQDWEIFILWCWRRLLRVPWIAKRSNQSIIKEIKPERGREVLGRKRPFAAGRKWRRRRCDSSWRAEEAARPVLSSP